MQDIQSLLTFVFLEESGCDRGHHALQVNVGAARTEQGQPAECSDRAGQEDPIQRGAQVHKNRYFLICYWTGLVNGYCVS